MERDVKPVRERNNRKVRRERWWQFAERAAGLYAALADLERVLVFAKTSRTQMPALVPSNQILSQALVMITTEELSRLGLHSSDFQYWWTEKYSSGMKADLRFTPSDCFETFSRPATTRSMREAGKELDAFRYSVMERRRIGLTTLYNLAHDETTTDEDVARLREIHVEIDESVREAYALDEEREPAIRDYEAEIASAPLPTWREIELGHGFHETRQGVRFTISAQARADVLDKLLALNHYRHEQEVKQGLHSGKGRGASRKREAGRASSGAVPALDDGGLFPPEGTLF